VKYITLLLTILLATVAFAKQTPAPDKTFGNYEGTVKGQAEKVELHLKGDAAKLSGRVLVGQQSYDITQGAVTNGMVSIVFKEGKLSGKIEGETLTGDLWVGNDKKAIELKHVPPTPAVPSVPATPEAKFVPNGQWEAIADANGQPFPFLLTLKVEGESVTGNSSSQLGEAAVKEGTWKDGKLAFILEGSNGNISMVATVVDGKLSGEFDYAGQLQGKWVAVRKQ
jgi:hypothetical protein